MTHCNACNGTGDIEGLICPYCDNGKRGNKYNARKVQDDGYVFDSAKEHRRYKELVALQRTGAISALVVHPKYTILDGYTRVDGKKIKAVTYIADFEYVEGGRTITEDVKGVQTAVFKLKRKLFEWRYRRVLRIT